MNFAEPDSTDTATVYADWNGTGDFQEVDPTTWTLNADGSVSFTHIYVDVNTDGSGNVIPFPAKFRIENDGGGISPTFSSR